jgi:terminase small subunit / prophage DNA-packing protein
MGKHVNQRELADICGKSVKAVQNWQGEGMPVYKHGIKGKENQYDTAAVINWLMARQAEKKQSEYDVERTRLARSQADKNELEVNFLKGVSLDARDIEPMWTALVLHIRTGFLNLPSKLSPRLSQEEKPEDIQKILQSEVDDILSALGKQPPQLKAHKDEN